MMVAERNQLIRVFVDVDRSPIYSSQASVAESDEDKPGITLDYDAAGNLVSLEVLDASQRVTEAKKIEFQTTG
jgi:YD repeat-containing protein